MADDFTTWCPDIDLTDHPAWRQNIARFGDGYRQSQLDGINALDRTFSVNYSNRDNATINAMIVYLEGRKGAAFAFKDPGTGRTYAVFCDEWQVDWTVARPDSGDHHGTLSADFIKANGVLVAGGAP